MAHVPSVLRNLVALGLFLVPLSWHSNAAAHGAPPGVLSIVDQDDSGPLVLRLGTGMAERRNMQWRFICPTRFQGEAQDPADALPGGGVAIATNHGLRVMRRDGTLVPHPDPMVAESWFVALTRSDAGLFGLRSREDLYDVVRIEAESARVVFTDTRHWSDIAVGDGYLLLVRYEGPALEAMTLSLDGQVLTQAKAMLPETPVAAYTRPVADMPYLVVGFVGAAYELGRIEGGTWRVLQKAGGHLAGPVQTTDGKRFIAIEGAIASFDSETVVPGGDTSSFVVGLRQFGSRTYACVTEGVRDVGNQGLGAQLFALPELYPPDLSNLSDSERANCSLEWQHLLGDLRAMNIEVANPTRTPANTGAAGNAGAVAPALAGSAGMAGVIVGGNAAQLPTAAPQTSTGCAVSTSSSKGGLTSALVFIGLAFVAQYTRRRTTPRAGRDARPD